MPVHFLWFLFDWRGRIGRGPYRIAILILALLVGALQLAPDHLHKLLVGVLAAQLVVQAALDAKRLHDIGFSAAWVPGVSVAGVCAAAALAAVSPEALVLAGRPVLDILGPAAAAGGPLAIAVAGLWAGAALRAALLWHPNSNAAGNRYAFAPGQGRAEASEGDDRNASSAEALIAKALAEQKRQASVLPEPFVRRTAPPRAAAAGGPRKSFGTRRSA